MEPGSANREAADVTCGAEGCEAPCRDVGSHPGYCRLHRGQHPTIRSRMAGYQVRYRTNKIKNICCHDQCVAELNLDNQTGFCAKHWRTSRPRKVTRKDMAIDATVRVDAIKLESGCTDCGYRDHAVALDFDHVRGVKKWDIARGKYERNWDDLLEEIAKCEVVCANCHRVRTKVRRRTRALIEDAT